jgi:hypothetical protein
MNGRKVVIGAEEKCLELFVRGEVLFGVSVIVLPD